MAALELLVGRAENLRWPRAPEEVLIPAIIRAVRIEPCRSRLLQYATTLPEGPAQSFPAWQYVICSAMGGCAYDFNQACGRAGGDR